MHTLRYVLDVLPLDREEIAWVQVHLFLLNVDEIFGINFHAFLHVCAQPNPTLSGFFIPIY